jgi:hypothetical protein
VSCIECLALVSGWKLENLDDLNVGWLGVFITPTTKLVVWWRLLSHGASDSPVRALTAGPAWMSGGTPDMHCRVSGAPLRVCLTSVRSGAQ